MSKKSLLFLLSLCMFAQWAVGQVHIVLPEVSDEGLESWDHFPLISPDSFLLNNFTLPADFSASDTTYSVLTFAGSKLSPKNDTLYMLWGDIQNGSPFLLIDANQNNDFSDDSLLRIMPGDTAIHIHLSPYSHPEQRHSLILWFEKNISEADYKFTFRMLAPPFLQTGKKLLPATYWPAARRLATRSGNLTIGSDRFKIGMYDGDFSGVYGDSPKDMLAIATPENKLKFRKSAGAVPLKIQDTIFMQQRVFELVAFSASGDNIDLRVIGLDLSHSDNTIPSLKVKTLSGDSAFLETFIADSGFTVFYCWGTWCKGCINQGPIFRKLINETKGVKAVGLVKDFEANAKVYCKKHGITWDQIMIDDRLTSLFVLEHFPQYILVDASGKVISRDMSISELEVFFRNKK